MFYQIYSHNIFIKLKILQDIVRTPVLEHLFFDELDIIFLLLRSENIHFDHFLDTVEHVTENVLHILLVHLIILHIRIHYNFKQLLLNIDYYIDIILFKEMQLANILNTVQLKFINHIDEIKTILIFYHLFSRFLNQSQVSHYQLKLIEIELFHNIIRFRSRLLLQTYCIVKMRLQRSDRIFISDIKRRLHKLNPIINCDRPNKQFLLLFVFHTLSLIRPC